jgi:hypothetical protein
MIPGAFDLGRDHLAPTIWTRRQRVGGAGKSPRQVGPLHPAGPPHPSPAVVAAQPDLGRTGVAALGEVPRFFAAAAQGGGPAPGEGRPWGGGRPVGDGSRGGALTNFGFSNLGVDVASPRLTSRT